VAPLSPDRLLAAQRAGPMSQQINLFDPDLRPRRQPLDALTMVISFVVLLTALLGYDQYAKRQLAGLEAQRAARDSQAKELQARVARLGAARAPDKALADDVARTEAQVRNWQQVLDRLHGTGIGNTEGHAKFLEALARQHADGVWLTEITVGESGDDFVLKGRMLRPELLGHYIDLLNREEALRGRAIGQMDVAQKPETVKAPEGAAKQAKQEAGGGPARFVEFSIASAERVSDTGAAR
jgi:Tfp pilus assembly protein PilN